MFSAFLDANILVPIALTDLLLRSAERDLYAPLWSQKVFDELRRALLKIHPNMGQPRIDIRLSAMQGRFPDACVEGYEKLIDTIDLPDPDDRHVVAAAIRGGADMIVTANSKDFRGPTLARFGLHQQTPDVFLVDLFDLYRIEMLDILAEQSAALTLSPRRNIDVLESLKRAGVPRFVTEVRESLDQVRH